MSNATTTRDAGTPPPLPDLPEGPLAELLKRWASAVNFLEDAEALSAQLADAAAKFAEGGGEFPDRFDWTAGGLAEEMGHVAWACRRHAALVRDSAPLAVRYLAEGEHDEAVWNDRARRAAAIEDMAGMPPAVTSYRTEG
jgi:hypothetical protein